MTIASFFFISPEPLLLEKKTRKFSFNPMAGYFYETVITSIVHNSSNVKFDEIQFFDQLSQKEINLLIRFFDKM